MQNVKRARSLGDSAVGSLAYSRNCSRFRGDCKTKESTTWQIDTITRIAGAGKSASITEQSLALHVISISIRQYSQNNLLHKKEHNSKPKKHSKNITTSRGKKLNPP